MVREAGIYCDGVVMDLEKRITLEERHPGQVMEVIYEEFVADPVQNTRQIYKFVGLEAPQNVISWIGRNSRDSAMIAKNWMRKMKRDVEERIFKHELCRELFKIKQQVWKNVMEL